MSAQNKSESDNDHIRPPPCPRERERFSEWKSRMLTLLDCLELRDVVTRPCSHIPHKTKLSEEEHRKWAENYRERKLRADSVVKNAEWASNEDVKIVHEIEQCRKAAKFIISSLSGNQLDLIENVFTINAYEIWNTINAAYGIVKTSETTMSLLRQLHGVKKEQNESMSEYFSRVDKICSRLKSLNHEIKEETWKLYVLEGLKGDKTWIKELELINKLSGEKEWDRKRLEEYLIKEENNMDIKNKENNNNNNNSNNSNTNKIEIAAVSMGENKNNNNNYNYNQRGSNGNFRGRGRGRIGFSSRGRGGRGGRGGYRNHYNHNNNHKNKNNKRNNSDDSDNKENENNNKQQNNNNNNKGDSYRYKRNTYSIECYKCGKYGHKERDCWGKRVRHESYTAISNDDDGYEYSYSTIDSSMNLSERELSTVWILDSGATSHHTGNRKLLRNIRKLEKPQITMTGDGESAYNEVGETSIDTDDALLNLRDVIFVPGFKVNLISVSKLTDIGLRVIYEGDRAVITDLDGMTLFTAKKRRNLFLIESIDEMNRSYERENDRNNNINNNNNYDDVNNNNALENKTKTKTERVRFAQAFTTNNNNNNNQNNDISKEKLERLMIRKQNYMTELRLMHERYGHISYTKLMNIITHNSVDDISESLKDKKLLRECTNEMIKSECEGCLKGKMSRLPMKGVVDYKVSQPMDLWTVDVVGPLKTETLLGHKYVLVIVDVFTRFVFVSLMKTKSETAAYLLNKIKLCQTQTNRKLKRLHSDGGKEIVNNEVSEYLKNNGTQQSLTTPHTPQHNGIVERANRSLMNMAKSMMYHCGSHLSLWGDAIVLSAYLIRMSLTNAHATCTPSELWSHLRPSIKHLHVFGCNAYYHIHKNNRDEKLSENAKIAIFVGYDETNSTYYKLYDVNENKYVVTRDVKFYDTSFTEMKKMKESDENVYTMNRKRNRNEMSNDDGLPDDVTDDMLEQLFMTDHAHHDSSASSSTNSEQPLASSSANSPPVVSLSDYTHVNTEKQKQKNNENNENVNSNDTNTSVVSLRGSMSRSMNRSKNESDDEGASEDRRMNRNKNKRNNKRNKRKNDDSENHGEKENENENENESVSELPRKRGRPRKVNIVAAAVENRRNEIDASNSDENDDDEFIPATYNEAISCNEKNEWNKAIDDEVRAHMKNKTWSVVERNENMNVIDTKWVFTKKRDENGVVKRFKARLVARGFHQQYGIDYKETFAPVIKLKSIRLIIALSATTKTKRKLAQLDVKTAFLNATVREDIYVSVPKGLEIGANKVLKLNKALYGIKQAPHEWNNEIDAFIISLNFHKCVKDTCVYVKMSETNNIIVLGLFVDDMIISYASVDENEWLEVKNRLLGKYELSDIGEAKVIVGMRLTKKNGYLYVDQRAYVKEKLEEFNINECREVYTPGDVNIMLNDSKGEVNKHTYMQISGSLIYALHTRPDIAHATNLVCRFSQKPNATHLRAAKRVLKYLKDTANYGLRYRNDENKYGNECVITGFSDADWAGEKCDRKSTTGYCVYVNDNLISWNTKKQQSVALSTAEAELMAIVETVREVEWLSMLLTEMGYRVKKPSTIWCDNVAAISITQHDSDHDRTKHIDIRICYIRDIVKKGGIVVKWIESGKQTADIFTKTVRPQVFLTHRNNLVYDVDESN